MSNASSSCFRLTLIVTVVIALSPLAQAHLITFGEVAPDLLTPGGTELAFQEGTISGVNGQPPFSTADYTTSVFSDPNNVFCSGCLDFTYRLTNNGPTRMFIVAMGAFSGIPVLNVGYDPTTNGVIPRSSTADTSTIGRFSPDSLSFYFQVPSLDPGQHTVELVVETDAHEFSMGDIVGAYWF